MFGDEGKNKLDFGVRENPRASHINETLVCGLHSCSLFCYGRDGFCLDIIEYLKVIYHGSANLPYLLRKPLQILKRASLARLPQLFIYLSAFYTQSKSTPAFSVKATILLL